MYRGIAASRPIAWRGSISTRVRGCRNDDHTAVRRGGSTDRFVEIDVRGHLDDDVDAASTGGGPDRVQIIRRAVIRHDIGALRADEIEPAVGAAGADDAQSVRMRQLHRRDADAARGAVHEHRFAGPRRRAVKEGAIGGRVGHAERCALRERRASGQAVELRGRAQGTLSACVPAPAGLDQESRRCRRDPRARTSSLRRRPLRLRRRRRIRA